MPRELFGDVTDPSMTLGTRKWYSVPLSFVVHALAISILIVTPLLATGALPLPDAGPTFVPIVPPALPDPPAVRAAPPAPPTVSRQAAPVVAPHDIAEEPDIDTGFEMETPPPLGVVGGSEIEIGGVVTAPPVVATPPPAAPIHVGGTIRPPQRIAYAPPVYPPLALSARAQGLVIIEATIDTNGQVQAARVLRSESPLLNQEALSAVRQWTYTPTLLNGVPVSVIMTVTVHFRLH